MDSKRSVANLRSGQRHFASLTNPGPPARAVPEKKPSMTYYPIYVNLQGRPVLIVGAGAVARQKISMLLDCAARLRVVAPEALPEIQAWAREGKLTWDATGYEASQLDGVRLVIAATDDEALQKRVAADARARNVWVNVVDVPPLCDFIAPSIVKQGDIQIAVSTGGAAPALSKFIRRKLEPLIGTEYAELVNLVKPARAALLKMPKEKRMAIWDRVVSDDFLRIIKEEGPARARALLDEWMHGK